MKENSAHIMTEQHYAIAAQGRGRNKPNCKYFQRGKPSSSCTGHIDRNQNKNN